MSRKATSGLQQHVPAFAFACKTRVNIAIEKLNVAGTLRIFSYTTEFLFNLLTVHDKIKAISHKEKRQSSSKRQL